jgi:hypothetical protein
MTLDLLPKAMPDRSMRALFFSSVIWTNVGMLPTPYLASSVRELSAEVDHLACVMVGMRGTTQEDAEPVGDPLGPNGFIG